SGYHWNFAEFIVCKDRGCYRSQWFNLFRLDILNNLAVGALFWRFKILGANGGAGEDELLCEVLIDDALIRVASLLVGGLEFWRFMERALSGEGLFRCLAHNF